MPQANQLKNMWQNMDRQTRNAFLIVVVVIVLVGIYSIITNNGEVTTNTTEGGDAAPGVEAGASSDNNSNENTTERSYSSIQTDFTIDTDRVNVLLPVLHERSTVNPSILCKEIIEKKSTRDNVYFYVEDELRTLNAKYASYRQVITYINDVLNGIHNDLQFVKSECLDRGYRLD